MRENRLFTVIPHKAWGIPVNFVNAGSPYLPDNPCKIQESPLLSSLPPTQSSSYDILSICLHRFACVPDVICTFNECLRGVGAKSVAHLMKFHLLQWEVIKSKILIEF